MLEAIFSTIGDAVTSFAGIVGNGFNGIISLFWDAQANTGAGAITPLGVLALIGAGVGLVYWAFGLVRGLLRVR